MSKLTNKYISISHYDYLLIVSALVVGVSMYLLFQKYSAMIICTTTKDKEVAKKISIRLTTATVLQKKEEIVPKKKVLETKKKAVEKIEPVKKDIVKTEPIPTLKKETVAIQEEVEEKEIIKEVSQEVQVQEEPTPSQNIAKPVFDAKMKEEFIAGLYRILNENKHYPKMARRRGLEGIVHIRFTLLKDGRLIDASLHKSSGYGILDRAALSLVASIKKYKPIPDEVSLVALDLNVPIKYSRE